MAHPSLLHRFMVKIVLCTLLLSHLLAEPPPLLAPVLAAPPPPVPESVEPIIAEDSSGYSIAVWEEKGLIQVSELPPNGNWTIPATLSNPVITCDAPQIEIDSETGDATVIWREEKTIRAATKKGGEEWKESPLEPTLVEEPLERSVREQPSHSPSPPSKKRLAIFLTPSEQEEARMRLAEGLSPSRGSASRGAVPPRKKNPKEEPPNSAPCSLDREPMSGAIDAPTGGSLTGMSIGFAKGQTTPTDGAIISGIVGINTSSPATTNVVTSRLHVASGSISIDASTQYNLQSGIAGSEASGGYWMGIVSGGLDSFINVSNDAATPRAISFTTSSNDAITGTISKGVLIWPLSGGITVGTTYAAARNGPPTNGAIIEGNVSIGTTSSITNLAVNGSSTSFDGVGSMQLRTANPGIGGGPRLLFGIVNAANAMTAAWIQAVELGVSQRPLLLNNSGGTVGINMTTAPGSTLSVSGGLSVGSSYAGTASPTNGAIIEGKVGINTSSVGSNTYVFMVPTVTASGALARGVEVGVNTLTAAANADQLRLIDFTTVTYATAAKTGLTASYLWVSPATAAISGGGTIDNAYGVYVDGFSSIATNQYSGYFLAPSGGTANTALYSTNLAVGYTAVTPPTNGAIISGQVAIGTSSATNLLTMGTINSTTGELIRLNGTVAAQSYMTVYGNATRQGYIGSAGGSGGFVVNSDVTSLLLQGTSVPIYLSGTFTGVSTGISIGASYYTTTPPSNGAIIQGKVGIGTTSVGSDRYVQFTLNTVSAASNYGMVIDASIGSSSGTITDAVALYVNPLLASNVATVTNAYGIYINSGNAAGTITTAYGLYVNAPVAGSTKCATYSDNLAVGYTGTAPPTNGAIISGQTSIGSSAPFTNFFFSTTAPTTACAAISAFGTLNGKSANREWGILSNPTLNPTGGASDRVVGIESTPVIIAPTATTIAAGMALFTNANWGSNVGTITTAYNCFIGAGTSGVGTITTGYGLYVGLPTMATTNYTALFEGSTANLFIASTGVLTPSGNKTLDIGTTGARFNTIYLGSAASVGTSRLARSQVACPQCGEKMMRGTGTLVILGEAGDYIPCWCTNDRCPQKGYMHMDEIKHLPSALLAQRKEPPEIHFLGFRVCQHSGNSRAIQVKFRYGDKENSTFLTDAEYADFRNMSQDEQESYLRQLGLREWYALEETRLMEEECKATQQELDAMVAKFIDTDLLGK